ncbi:MAG: TfoX/Sxy family protein [Bacteroidota bacterium]
MSLPISTLRNLGPRSARMLEGVGIHTRADLEQFGPALAYAMVRDAGYGPGKNLLWAIAGALQDRHWLDLSSEEKADLLAQIDP